jgi:hypothetical protein
MAEFKREDFSGSRFERVDLSDSTFIGVDFARADFRVIDMTGVVMRNADMVDVRIDGEVRNLVINDVDVGPYIEAELDRRYPERPKMRPTDAAGFREGWDVIERLWGETVARARTFSPDQLHESVDDEWSFIETLRHLVFATDSWVRRAILGDPAPWHPLDLPWDEMPDTPGVPRDRAARPTLDEVLALRADRMASVRSVIDELTDEALAGETKPVEGPGWPPPEAFPLNEVLLIILNEEWYHRLFAERDLDVLESRA